MGFPDCIRLLPPNLPGDQAAVWLFKAGEEERLARPGDGISLQGRTWWLDFTHRAGGASCAERRGTSALRMMKFQLDLNY